jgi:glycosyltransferase involved in cell wall biosynthesis
MIKSGNGAFLPQLANCLRSYDIVHLHYPFFGANEIVWLSKTILRQKFILALHFHMEVAGLSGINKLLKIPDSLIKSSLWYQSKAISCASLDYVQNLKKHKTLYNKYKNKYFEIPFGVNTDFFQPLKNKKNYCLKIVFVGGMDKAHYFKGIPVLFQALKKIKKLNWSLALVGSGDLAITYKQKEIELGIASKIKFLGGLNDNDLKKIYQVSDLLILPAINKNEAFGIVLLEAMASGLAVIASRLPGVRTVFTDKQEGYYFEPNNVDDLALKIKKLIKQTKILDKMSVQARKTALNKYDDSMVSQRLITFYENLLNK